MVVGFSSVDIYEQPVLLLKEADNSVLTGLGYAKNLKVDFMYNEVSSISFDYPAYLNGVAVPHYDDIIGMRYIDLVGYGLFILVDPSVSKDGMKETKSCKAYSLEYELTYKKISLTEDVYNFYSPLSAEESVMDIILDYLPMWSIGSIDVEMYGVYRNFLIENENLYNFIKSTLQQTYNCIFDFDTYNRKINVVSVTSEPKNAPIYISMDNLAKSVKISEDTENIFTVLDVNGADGVDIRGVNPTGENKIYNIDYFIEKGCIENSIVAKWRNWETLYENYQQTFYNWTIELALKNTAILTEQAYLYELENGGNETDSGLAVLENEQSVVISLLASMLSADLGKTDSYAEKQAQLTALYVSIEEKKAEISKQESYIATLESEKDSIMSELSSIQSVVSMKNESNFTSDEYELLRLYFKEESIEDSTFVISNVDNYSDDNASFSYSGTSVFSFTSGEVTKTEFSTTNTTKDIYTFRSGVMASSSFSTTFSTIIISGTLEVNKTTGEFVLSGYLSNGQIGGQTFTSGCVSITGTYKSASNSDTSLTLTASFAKIYFTKNATEYNKQAIAFELIEYGQEVLYKISQPTCTFKVETANFFALEEFISFTRNLTLGQRAYVNLEENNGVNGTLEPILIGVSLNFEDWSSLTLTFSDSYTSRDATFDLASLLDQSISMGKTVNSGQYNFNSFVSSNASNNVKDFMDSALDVAKNMVLSSTGQAISWDESGLKLRKYVDGSTTEYDDKQIYMINNNICFTNNGWKTANMAIGELYDINTDSWVYGIVAPYLVGTVLAGQNLLITNENKSFKVDGSGMWAYNASIVLQHTVNDVSVAEIAMSPEFGLVGGAGGTVGLGEDSLGYTTVVGNFLDSSGNITFDKDGYPEGFNFFLDLRDGSAYFRGDIYADNGIFNGKVQANEGYFENLAYGTLLGDLTGLGNSRLIGSALYVGGTTTNADKNPDFDKDTHNFMVDGDGNCKSNGDFTLSGDIYMEGDITWGKDSIPTRYQYSVTGKSNWVDTYVSGTHFYRRESLDGGANWGEGYLFPTPEYIQPYGVDFTKITSDSVETPMLKANKFTLYPQNVFTTDFFPNDTQFNEYAAFTLNGPVKHLYGAVVPYFSIALADYIPDWSNADSYMPLVVMGSSITAAVRFQFDYCSFPTPAWFYDEARIIQEGKLVLAGGSTIVAEESVDDGSGNKTYIQHTVATADYKGVINFGENRVKGLYMQFK